MSLWSCESTVGEVQDVAATIEDQQELSPQCHPIVVRLCSSSTGSDLQRYGERIRCQHQSRYTTEMHALLANCRAFTEVIVYGLSPHDVGVEHVGFGRP